MLRSLKLKFIIVRSKFLTKIKEILLSTHWILNERKSFIQRKFSGMNLGTYR